MAVRAARPSLFAGLQDGTHPDHVLKVCDLSLDDVVCGVVMGVPMEPEALLSDQARAVDCMAAAVDAAGDLDAVGLGSLCALVAGRGEALAEQLSVPVTNGGAATAWAIMENALSVLQHVGRDRPVAVLGARGPVGGVITEMLVEAGLRVHVDHPRAARGLDVHRADSPEAAVQGCRVVIGAATTGAMLQAESLASDAILIDVAIPGTIIGTPGPGVQVLAGEALSMPIGWRRGMWGWLYQVLAGYGPAQVFACLVEPIVLALNPEVGSFSLGRTLSADKVKAFGTGARSLGFEPRLARGWSAFPVTDIPRQITG